MTNVKKDFCAVVSIHKSGINLVAKLMEQLGYHTIGHGLTSTDATPDKGLPVIERDFEFITMAEEKSCFFTHSLPLHEGDGSKPAVLTRLWMKRKFPLIFNYRDPRAVICSLIDYVLGKHYSGKSTSTPFQQICAEIFEGKKEDEQLDIAIEILEGYLNFFYREHIWLLRHPRVCSISYEDLCGPKGGGSSKRQHATVGKVISTLDVQGDIESISNSIYAQDSRTFNIGQINSWQSRFSDRHLVAFEKKYGDILDSYGYSRHCER